LEMRENGKPQMSLFFTGKYHSDEMSSL